MGFRSTFTTSDYMVEWPTWFREKYDGWIHFGRDGASGSLSAAREGKTYGIFESLPQDIQHVLNTIGFLERGHKFEIAYLHECGGITRCQIEKDAIRWSEPLEWWETDGVSHDYCYGCSDLPAPEPSAAGKGEG